MGLKENLSHEIWIFEIKVEKKSSKEADLKNSAMHIVMILKIKCKENYFSVINIIKCEQVSRTMFINVS